MAQFPAIRRRDCGLSPRHCLCGSARSRDIGAAQTPGPPVTDPPVPVPVPSPSPAPVARFVGIADAVPLNFFEATTSAPDSVDSNILRIGFDRAPTRRP